MDSDEGKLFVGGISWETTEEKLKDHFGNYGLVSQAVIMRDKATGRPRGFGFVIFADPSDIDRVLQDRHTIDGRTVEAKRAMSREEQQASKTLTPNSSARNSSSSLNSPNIRTKKIFVGGLPPSITDEGFKSYFESYGTVTDIVIMIDQNTGRPRGFGFVTFDSEESVDRVLHKTFHDLNGKSVEVKRALPRDSSLNSGGGGGGGRISGGGLYQGGGVTTNPNSNMGGYDSRGDGNRYMQAQQMGYGNTGYGSGYGYTPGNTGAGYGAYGYGGMPAGVPAGTGRATWTNQPQSGYGNTGAYGSNTGYSTGPVQPGQGATGYGYGYNTDQPAGGYSGYGGSNINAGFQSGNQGGLGFNGGLGGYGGYGGAQQRPAQ